MNTEPQQNNVIPANENENYHPRLLSVVPIDLVELLKELEENQE